MTEDVSVDGHLGRENFCVIGSLVVHLVGGQGKAETGGELLQLVLRVAEATLRRDVRDRTGEEIDDETRSSVYPDRQVDGRDDRFEAVRQDRVLASAPRALLTLAKEHRLTHAQVGGDRRQSLRTDYRGSKPCEIAFGQVGERAVEVIGDHEAQDGVTEELQAFVGWNSARLRAVRTVGKRLAKQDVVDRVPTERRAQLPSSRGRLDLGRLQAASTFALT